MGGHVTNVVAGGGGPVVQARTVIGDIHFTAQQPCLIPARQLPGHVLLADRGAEQKALARIARLDHGRSRIVQVTGPPGSGKTTLATGWLRRYIADHPDAFPGGQLYIDLRAQAGTDPRSAAADVLGMFLRALGVPAGQVPEAFVEREALYRSVTAALRLAVVLDGASSATHVLPLLPSAPESLTLVTTERLLPELVALGAARLEVPSLDGAGVHQVLEAFLGPGYHHDITLASVVAVCTGGLASTVADLIVAACTWGGPLPEFLAHLGISTHLGHEEPPMETLMLEPAQALNTAVASLTKPERDFYAILGLFPSTGAAFDVEASAAITDRNVDHARDMLTRLVGHLLVHEVDKRAGVYRMDRTIHEHAHEFFNSRPWVATPSVAVWRLVHWWVHAVRLAARTIMPSRSQRAYDAPDSRGVALPPRLREPSSALAWLAERSGAIVPLLRCAGNHGMHREIVLLADAVDVLVTQHGDHDFGRTVDALALDAVQRCADPDLEFTIFNRLARHHAWLGQTGRAHSLAGQCLAYARRTGQFRHLAKAFKTLGIVHATRPGQAGARTAAHFHERATDLYARLGKPRSEGLARTELGIMLHVLGRLDDADRELHRAHQLLDAEDDTYNRARVDIARADIALTRAITHADRDSYATARKLALRADHALAVMGEPAARAKAREILRRCAEHTDPASAAHPFPTTCPNDSTRTA
ncbi:ATP-binding protein [Amycolatopsis anabasis]|uniref:ATP-binding protein n=1 Tax=Amycolatopsis anabasis TaxID=1840409 RepID=UPI00131E995F|nr:ATP-binding protein [Amycolatopsis anabasis]